MDELEIFCRNEQRKWQERLNRIGAELRVEYIDFLDAKDMEMSVDLGENLRIQLDSIFRILKKAGVPIQR